MEKIYLRPEIIENGSLNASYILNPNTVKTINGSSILGYGNIELCTEDYVDEHFATKDQMHDLSDSVMHLNIADESDVTVPKLFVYEDGSIDINPDSGLLISNASGDETLLRGDSIAVANNTMTVDISDGITFNADTKITAGTSHWDTLYSTLNGGEQTLKSALDTKQATLTSGTNIKTINGISVLGSGNIEISAGGVYESGKNIDISSYAISTVDDPKFNEITVGDNAIYIAESIQLRNSSTSMLLTGGPENILFNFDDSQGTGNSLNSLLNSKADDDSAVHKTGNENISGNKTFSFGSTVSLLGGTMATTKVASTNDTSIATTAFVHSAISYDTAALISRIEYLETVISYIVNIDQFAQQYQFNPEEFEPQPEKEINELEGN